MIEQNSRCQLQPIPNVAKKDAACLSRSREIYGNISEKMEMSFTEEMTKRNLVF